MSNTVQQIINDHRKHYLDRKLARSPLLHFSPNAYRLDLHELFRGIQQNVLAVDTKLSGVSSPSTLLASLLEGRFEGVIHGVQLSTIKKLERIQKAAADTKQATGQHTLFLGYPCIVIPHAKNVPKLAPLTLFAVQFSISGQKLTIRRVSEVNEQGQSIATDAVLNRLLCAYVKREFAVDLKSSEYRFDIQGAEVEQRITDLLSPWRGVKREFSYPKTSAVISNAELKGLRQDTTDPYVADHAIIGLAEFSGQALLDDLDQLQKLFETDVRPPPAFSRLVTPAAGHQEHGSVEPGFESRKWLVEKSDPSQEQVVWAQKTNPLVVLQGPPGTGKSQTIVNIVADALAQKKTVMVVCQKRSAIEVVYKRLSGVGLGELAVLIDDIDKDRLSIVRRIDGIDIEFKSNPLHERERTAVASDVMVNEAKIDAIVEAFNDRSDGKVPNRMRFGDIKAKLKELHFLNLCADWPTPLKRSVAELMASGIALSELKTKCLEFKEVDDQALELRYGQNTWTKVDSALGRNQVRLEEILGLSETVCSLGIELASRKGELHHDTATAWVAEHPWFHQSESGFPVSGFLEREGQRHYFEKYQRWLAVLRTLAAVNPLVDTNRLSESLRMGSLDIEFLARLRADASTLKKLVALKSSIAQEPVLAMADQYFPHARGHWENHIYSMALHNWLSDLLERQQTGFADAPKVSSLVMHLGRAISQKRVLDAQHILNGYRNRVNARDTLKDQNLLRLRAGKGRPKTSLRKLWSEGMSKLNSVVPLLLVSPETACSMLPLKAELFDLVIIDEASQMFVAEALPILFRAKHAVIAGDRHQMPPSDIFAYSDNDDGSDNSVENNDEEPDPLVAAEGVYRLLDAADSALPAASQSRLSLLVHYRSERKELIDYSNHAFYDGSLIIPAGNAKLLPFMQTAIEFEAIAGQFKGGVNEMECKRIVELLKNIWMIRESARPTLGVIVVNAKQRDRVLEVLQEQCECDASFRVAYEQESDRSADGEDVSFFVRNVENVQGDERDLIIFGFTYSGSSRNFGPLNKKEDGRKRLNVAVTRAKRGMVVLCSSNVGHISNITEKGTEERYYVWQYLNYAKAVAADDHAGVEQVLNQLNSQRGAKSGAINTTESPFEEDVKEFVEGLGFCVNCQVGESGFRIDLGVRIKQEDRYYLCGLECDGARYHSGWRARTNDVWRQEILESKGWKILRIWSTDWFENPEHTKSKLSADLFALRDTIEHQFVPEQHQFINRPAADAVASVISTVKETSKIPVVKRTTAVRKPKDAVRSSTLHLFQTPPLALLNEQVYVEVGDTVEYEYLDDAMLASAQIVRGIGNPESGTINRDSALAKALLDTVVGETVEFLLPKGKVKVVVRRINKSPA